MGPASPEFLDVVPRYPDTTFVFLDWCCLEGTELEGSPNAVALSLRADQVAHLAGYLSALVESRRVLRAHREHMVSIVGADPHFPIVQTWVRGFSEGVHRAAPTMKIRVDYSNDFANRAICERIANRQIDAGSGVVSQRRPTAGSAPSPRPRSGVCGGRSRRGSVIPRVARPRIGDEALGSSSS